MADSLPGPIFILHGHAFLSTTNNKQQVRVQEAMSLTIAAKKQIKNRK
jgi:hypothetical protein